MGTPICGKNEAVVHGEQPHCRRHKCLLPTSPYKAQGSFGNLGMYIPAILVGIVVDSKGPRLGVALGAVLLGIGYAAIYFGWSESLQSDQDIDIVSFCIWAGLLRRGYFMFLLLSHWLR
jgi:hypothetical protein